ncbi:MAG: hypothetical protein NDF56_06810 [archaeon GB-1845-036]|nr:hypothetical protein [Candidatus Culexmicrobium thermophilum]
MSEKASKKYAEIQSKIERSINPYITVKIPMPRGVEKDEFLKLEEDEEFIEFLKNEVLKWIKERQVKKEN